MKPYNQSGEVKDCKHTKSGSTYKGKISKTASGIVCQEWAKSKPHGHSFTTRLAGDSNHCRNPDGSDKPWCYTVNEKTRWQYCSVPDCGRKNAISCFAFFSFNLSMNIV